MKDFFQHHFYRFLDFVNSINVVWELLFYWIIFMIACSLYSQACGS